MADSRFFENVGPLTLKKIVEISGAKIDRDLNQNQLIQDVAPLNKAGPNDLSFMDNLNFKKDFLSSKAGYCFISKKFESLIPETLVPLYCKNPYKSYGLIASEFYNFDLLSKEHSKDFDIHPSVSMGKKSYISRGTVV